MIKFFVLGRRLCSVFIVILCAGCVTLGGGGQFVWSHPEKTQEQFQQDYALARLEAEKHGYVAPSPFGDPLASGFYAGMMTADQQNRIITAYMQAKGYTLVRRDSVPKPPVIKMGTQKIAFDPTVINTQPSKASVKGQVFLATPSGGVNIGAGKLVELIPLTPYTNERFQMSASGVRPPPRDPELAKFVLSTVADADGRFEFQEVPFGEYLVVSTVGTAGQITVSAKIDSDRVFTVMVTR